MFRRYTFRISSRPVVLKTRSTTMTYMCPRTSTSGLICSDPALGNKPGIWPQLGPVARSLWAVADHGAQSETSEIVAAGAWLRLSR